MKTGSFNWLFAHSVCNMYVTLHVLFETEAAISHTCAMHNVCAHVRARQLRLRSRRAIEMYCSATPLHETRCYAVV